MEDTNSHDIWRRAKYFIPIFAACLPLIITLLHMNIGAAPSSAIASYFRDPATTMTLSMDGVSPYVGFYSQVGSVLWLSGATMCLLVAFSIYAIERSQALMLIAVGSLVLFMGLDDLLLFHDWLARRYFGLGQREFMLFDATIILLIGLTWRRQIKRYDQVFFPLALGFFALSLAVDTNQGFLNGIMGESLRIIAEDGFKFLGITALWTGCLKLSFGILREHLAGNSQKANPTLTP